MCCKYFFKLRNKFYFVLQVMFITFAADLEKLFEAYISVARLDEPETNLPPDVEKETDEKEFGDQEVSTLIECLNMEVIGISQAFCEASDR